VTTDQPVVDPLSDIPVLPTDPVITTDPVAQIPPSDPTESDNPQDPPVQVLTPIHTEFMDHIWRPISFFPIDIGDSITIETPICVTMPISVGDGDFTAFDNEITAVIFSASVSGNTLDTLAIADQATPAFQNVPTIEPSPIAIPQTATMAPTSPISSATPVSITQLIVQDTSPAAGLPTAAPTQVQVTATSAAPLALSTTSRDRHNEPGAFTAPTSTSVADELGGTSESLGQRVLAKFRGILALLSLS
jgi:hypothetical protein